MNGSVPFAYARRTLEATEQNLLEESQTLGKSSDLPVEQRMNAQAQVARLQQIVSQLKASVEGKDQVSLSSQVEQLRLAEQMLRSSFPSDSVQP